MHIVMTFIILYIFLEHLDETDDDGLRCVKPRCGDPCLDSDDEPNDAICAGSVCGCTKCKLWLLLAV